MPDLSDASEPDLAEIGSLIETPSGKTRTATRMQTSSKPDISFVRLTEVSPDEIAEHMRTPRVTEHMPLATEPWDARVCAAFVRAKEACWQRDGLGHWGILADGSYVGWGGFQKEGDEWDFGLVLKPAHFGLGLRITRKALEFAKADERISRVTFLLPPSRRYLGALQRLGAETVGEIEYAGQVFLKFRLDTA